MRRSAAGLVSVARLTRLDRIYDFVISGPGDPAWVCFLNVALLPSTSWFGFGISLFILFVHLRYAS